MPVDNVFKDISKNLEVVVDTRIEERVPSAIEAYMKSSPLFKAYLAAEIAKAVSPANVIRPVVPHTQPPVAKAHTLVQQTFKGMEEKKNRRQLSREYDKRVRTYIKKAAAACKYFTTQEIVEATGAPASSVHRVVTPLETSSNPSNALYRAGRGNKTYYRTIGFVRLELADWVRKQDKVFTTKQAAEALEIPCMNIAQFLGNNLVTHPDKRTDHWKVLPTKERQSDPPQAAER